MNTASDPARARTAPSGARSGALLGAASVVATGLNYVFLLAAGRILGSDAYGALAALLGLLTVVLLPTGAVQLAVSREVSRRIAVGDTEGAEAFARSTLRLGLIVTAPLVAVGLALAVPLREVLNIDSTGSVLLAAVGLTAALAFPIAIGVLQGYERFHAVAAMFVLPFALRLVLLALVAGAGYRLGGAVLSAIAGAIASAAVAVALVREPLRRGARAARPALGPFLRYLWPVVVGLIGIAVLTNVDLLVAKARFSDDAGEYAAASAFARVAFFLPATILAVLFPRTAARQARGEDTADILGRSVLVTAGFGALLTLFYAMTGRGLVHTSFGAEFAAGGELLVPFTIEMTLFALAHLLVGFHLSRNETRYAWIVAAAVPVQIAVLAFLPNDVEGVIWTDLVLATALLCAHELFVESSVPALGAGVRHIARDLRIPLRTVTEGGVVLLAATAFVCALFWPLVAHMSSMVVGSGSDSVGQIWDFWRMKQESGYHLFGTTHTDLTGAPFGWEKGNGLNLQAVLVYYPAYLATRVIGEVAAYNLILLSGYVLSGASMYALTRYLGCARIVAAWAAMVYIVFPWHLMRTPHASLTHLELLPLLLIALVAAARRPSWWRFGLVGLATLGCWLTAGYIGTMALVGAAAFALAAAASGPLRRGGVLVAGSVAGALGASLVVAFLSMLSGVGRGAGLNRVAGDLLVYGIRPLELVVPAAQNLVLDDRLRSFWEGRLHGSNPVETSNYLGVLTMGLALGWLVIAWLRRRLLDVHVRIATAGLVGVLVVALLLAIPSPVDVFGRQITMPSRLLWEVVPAIRVPSRWVALVMTALVPLAALGLQAAWRRFVRRGRPQVTLALVVGAMLVSFLELSVVPTEPRIRTTLPPEYRALERTSPGVLVEYPLIEDIDNLFWQRDHQRPVLNSLAFGTPADDARRVVLDPASPGSAEKLAFLGVTAIVTHRNALSYTDGVASVPNASWGPGYALVARTSDGGSVWRVVAPPAPALVTLHSGFGDPRHPEGDRVAFPLISTSGVGYFELRAKEAGIVRLSFTAEPPNGERRVLRVADVDTDLPFTLDGRTAISLLVEVPSGLSRLLVKTDPAATSADDAIDVTAPRSEPASGTSDLQAESISPDVGF